MASVFLTIEGRMLESEVLVTLQHNITGSEYNFAVFIFTGRFIHRLAWLLGVRWLYRGCFISSSSDLEAFGRG